MSDIDGAILQVTKLLLALHQKSNKECFPTLADISGSNIFMEEIKVTIAMYQLLYVSQHL